LDGAFYKSGKNLNFLIKALQESLNTVTKWADSWGMKISSQKSCGVIFTHKIDQKVKSPLMLGNQPLKMETSVRFLGMIFDSRLNWMKHCQYVEDRCKTRLNFMRSITGTKWGASKSCLLVLYKALIRSVLDYGAIALTNACKNAQRILDSIQARALRICCGAMQSTSIAALQVECGEPPLDIRRLRQQLNYSIKLLNSSNNPAVEIMKDSWTNYWGKNSKTNNNQSNIYLNTNEFYSKNRDKMIGEQFGAQRDPPWNRKPTNIDVELTKQFSKDDPPENRLAMTRNRMQNYEECLKVYTDGSRKEGIFIIIVIIANL